MTIYSVQGPDGRIYDIEGPEGASERQIIAALQRHLGSQVEAPKPQPKAGFMPNVKAGIERIKGDYYAGLAALGRPGAAEEAAAHRKKAGEIAYTPEFTEHPLDFLTSVAGGSVPYMAAPLAAGAAATPLGTLGAMGAAGLASGLQFTGSDLSRQLEEGTRPEALSLGAAAAAAVPQAALDVIGFRYIPGIRTLFAKAGVPLTNEAAKGIVGKYILPAAKTAGVEGATEAGQAVFERLQAGLSITDPEARKEYFDNFVGGAVLGGALAVPGTMLEGRRRPPEQPVAPPVEAPVERERGEITTIPPTERGEIGVAEYKAPAEEAPAAQEAIQLGYTPTPTPNVVDLMDQYQAAQPRISALEEQLQEAAAAGDTAKARDLFGQLQTARESVAGLKTQIEELGGVAKTSLEHAEESKKAFADLDKKIKATQKQMADAGQLGDFDKIPKLADKLDALQEERTKLEETVARQQELLRVQATPKDETIPLFATDQAQPMRTKVLRPAEAGAGALQPEDKQQALLEKKEQLAEAEQKDTSGMSVAEKGLHQENISKLRDEIAELGYTGARQKVDQRAVTAKEAEIEEKATALVAMMKAGPKAASEEKRAAALAEVNQARERLAFLKERSQAATAGEMDEALNRAQIDLKNATERLENLSKKEALPRHITEVNRASEELNKLYAELDALRGGRPLPTESPMALFQRENLIRTALVNGDKRTADILLRAQREDERRGQRGMSDKEKLAERVQQRLNLPGTVVERAVFDEDYDATVEEIDNQINKIVSKQGNAKESYLQKAERLYREMQLFAQAAEDPEATPHQRAMARRTFEARLKEYETILNGRITPAYNELYKLYTSLYTKKEVAPASEIEAKKRAETEAAGRAPREKSREAKQYERITEGKGVKAAPARVARELGYETEEYQKLAAAAQKKIDTKIRQHNAFVEKAKAQLEALKAKKGETSDAYKTKEAAFVKAANQRIAAFNEFKQALLGQLDTRAEELGRAAPEMRSKLIKATKEVKKAAAQTTQELKSKRTTQVTRRVAKLGVMPTGTEESKARAAGRQARFEETLEKTKTIEQRERVKKALKEVEKKEAKPKTAMEAAMTKAATKKAEEGKFARGVEVESPDLTTEQLKHLENNDVVSAFRSIANDKNASELNRAVATRLAAMLDNTSVELFDRLYAPDGKEVLGEAISTKIKLSRAGGLSQEVLLHEGTHAAVERVIQMPDSMLTKEQIIAKRELNAIYNTIKNDPSITSANAKSSLSEFAAEVFSNRNLQEQLRKRKWRGSDLWNGLKSVILRLLGVKVPETQLGAALKSVDLLMIPSSDRIGRVEKPVNRRYSAKDIAALETGSNSMRVFAEQFGPEIKQKDRTPEDVERIAAKYLNDFENNPENFVAQVDSSKLDYKTAATMSDGNVYDPENPLHFVEADVGTLAAYDAMKSPHIANEEARAVNKARNNALLELAIYLTANPSYTLAEQALVAKAASKYGVISGRDGRLKIVNLSDNNKHPVAVVGRESANAVIEELRKGKSLKDAFLGGLQTNADANASANRRKDGWQKFAQSNKYEDAVALNAGAANTPWCTGGSVSTAESQIKNGDFYIYYENGKPEVAVRMDGTSKIGEIRGNLPNQALSKKHQQLAKAFILDKGFKDGRAFVEEMDRKETLIKMFSDQELTPEDFSNFGNVVNSERNVDEKGVKRQLKFRNTFGYGSRDIPESVVQAATKKITQQLYKAYDNGYWFMDYLDLRSDVKPTDELKTSIGGKDFTTTWETLKAANDVTAYSRTSINLPELRTVKRLAMFSDTNIDATKLLKVGTLLTYGTENTVLNAGNNTYIDEIRAYSSGRSETNQQITVNGKVRVGRIDLTNETAALDVILPDSEDIGSTNDPFEEFKARAPNRILSAIRSALRDAKIDTDVLHVDFKDRDAIALPDGQGTMRKDPIATQKIQHFIRAINDQFGTRAVQNYYNKEYAEEYLAPDEKPAIDDVIHDFLQSQYDTLRTEEALLATNRKLNKIIDAIAPESYAHITERLGTLNAPNRILNAEFTVVEERPRYAPKDVGVQEDKPGIFSFKSARQESSIAPSFVAKNPTQVDRLKANFLGLTGRVQFVDRYAALSEAFKKGMDAEKIKALEGEQAEYYLRFGEQRSQFAGQFLTNGPVRLVKEETKRGTEYVYKSTPGVNMMQVADAIAKSKIGNDTEKEAILTALVAGERAKQVGWNKLNFANPSKAAAEYNQIKKLLDSRPEDKAMFDKAMDLYQQYNHGMLDLLVQTGTMSKDKVAELKKITYVPFYRINKGTGEIELMIDSEHPVRIGNIKDEPQLKELVGDSTEILPIFTSSVQNTFLLTEMALRNQAVKESAFILNKMGIASTIGKGTGPAGPNTVRFKHKGEDHFVVIDTDLYGIPASLIVKGMEGIKTTIPAAVRMLGMPADILRKFVTRNPAYAIKQAIRDPMTAWMTTGVDGVPVLNSMKELASMVAGRSEAEKKLMEAGAISSNVFTGDKGDMEKFLKEISMGKTGWQKIMARADAFALQGDAATRAVLYRDSLNKGMSEMQAYLRTLESMNFSRRGVSPSMQMLSVLIPFFNAQIQGLDVLYRAFKGKMPYDQQLEIRKKLLARGTLMAVGTLAYAMMMEDDEAYKKAKPEERLGNWFLPTPFADEPLRIPVPFELGYLFKSLPEAVYNLAADDERNKDVTKGMTKLVMLSNPFSLPQAIKPATEVYLGKSFFGGDIESQRELHTMTPSERARESTTELSKMLGSITGDAGLSPIKLDYLIRGYTGGLGIALVSLANPLLNAEAPYEKPSTKVSKMPFIGGLFQPVEGRGTLDAAYARMLEVQQAKGTYERMLQQGRKEDAKEFMEEYINRIAAASVSGSVQQKLGELAKARRQVEIAPRLSAEQKDEILKRIDTAQNKLAENFLRATDETTLRAYRP